MRWSSTSRIASALLPLWAVAAAAVCLAIAATPAVAQTHGDSVWVNLHSGVYHCPGSHSYGAKHGQYMTEAAARSGGYRPAKGRSCGTVPAVAARETTTRPGATTAHEGQVWVNTRSHAYHCPGTAKYGTSHEGVYMTEQAAVAAGNRPEHGRRCQ